MILETWFFDYRPSTFCTYGAVSTKSLSLPGAGKDHYKTFLICNLIGGFLWANIFTYLGFFIGEALTKMGE